MPVECPKCGSRRVHIAGRYELHYGCRKCGHQWLRPVGFSRTAPRKDA